MKSISPPFDPMRRIPPEGYDARQPSSPKKEPPSGENAHALSKGARAPRPDSPRSFSAEGFPQISARARQFLNDLRKATRALGKLAYSNHPEVAPKDGEEGCVAATMVTVRLENNVTAPKHPIDANRIEFMDHHAKDAARSYIAGRSPANLKTDSAPPTDDRANFVEFEKCLVQGIESRQGIFQFVGQRAHHTPEQSFDKPIIYQLLAMQGHAEASRNELLLGGRYQVKNLSVLTTGDSAAMHDHCHYRLEVFDTETNGTVTVPLTQAALPFDEGIFRIPEIIRADQLCAVHNGFVTDITPAEPRQQTFAAVFSKKGVIRNATTLTYFDLSRRIADRSIKDEQELGTALRQAIMQGRKARGIKKFIPSTRQVALLRSALVEKLQQQVENENAKEKNRIAHVNLADKIAASDKIYDSMPFGELLAVNEPRTRPFSMHAFQLRQNDGGGNCLFHALEGTSDQPTLDNDAITVIRNRVADIRKNDCNDQDDEGNPEKNALACGVRKFNYMKVWAEYQLRPNPDFDKFLFRESEGELLQEISNEEYAECQRSLNFYASDDEIQQWLSLEENRNKTIVVIDDEANDADEVKKQIVQFTFGQKPKRTPLSAISGNEKDVSDTIARNLAPAIEQEQDRSRTGTASEIALFRSARHFERIVKHHNIAETKQAYVSWLQDIERQYEQAKNLNYADIKS